MRSYLRLCYRGNAPSQRISVRAVMRFYLQLYYEVCVTAANQYLKEELCMFSFLEEHL